MVERVAISLVTPSMMTRGSLPPTIDVVPRTRTDESCAIRSMPFEVTLTPAALPFNTSRALFTIPLFCTFRYVEIVSRCTFSSCT